VLSTYITARVYAEKFLRFASVVMFALTVLSEQASAHPRHSAEIVQDRHDGHPTLSTDENARLKALRAAAASNPSDATASVAFARFASRLARRDGDTSLLKAAEKALAHWERDEEPSIDILIVRANIKQIDHRFDEALADLETVIIREPGNPQARLSRAFVLATIGKAQNGRADCARLRSNVSLIIRETCLARVAGLTGEAERSLMRLSAALDTFAVRSESERAFALSVAAEIAVRLGYDDQAETLYKALIGIDARSVFSRAAYADFLIGQKRMSEARDSIGDQPNTEVLLLLRVLANAGLSDKPASMAAVKLTARMDADFKRADISHAREYARFALYHLDDPALAIALAQKNWRAQKEPIDARILLEAAQAASDNAAIDEIAAWVEMTKLEDKRLQALLQAAKVPA